MRRVREIVRLRFSADLTAREIDDFLWGSSRLAGRVSCAFGGGDALCEIHGGCRDGVFVAVVQGERR